MAARSASRRMTARAGIAVSVVALSAALLSACSPPAHHPTTAGPSHSTPATPHASPTPAETATHVPVDPTVITPELRANVVDAMTSGNTAALDGYLASTVRVTYAASEAQGDVTDHTIIINDLTELTAGSPTWDFNLDPSLIAIYTSGPSYADDFPTNSIAGLSSNQQVVSFTVEGGLITRVFIALVEDSLHP